jgi:hypothetical protein
MDNRRTDTARDNDDSELIDEIEPTPPQEGRSGGNLQADIATQAELERVDDPEAHEGVDKQDDIDHGQRYPARHARDNSPGGGSD